MSGSKIAPETPRQKMIGMMYLVLMAMLALNVSSDILQGFTLVDNSLHTSIESSDKRNSQIFDDFNYLYSKNPTKVGEWLDKANEVKKQSDDLFNYIQDFKVNVLKLADDEDYDPAGRLIKDKENLDVAGQYAIAEGNGKILKEKIEAYKKMLMTLSPDSTKKQIYSNIFSTSPKNGVPWIEANFEMMPVIAVTTVLTKYQSDVRNSQAEIVQFLKNQTDATDYRVNRISAFVIPESRYVIKGERYKAKIVLAAIDSTKAPEIVIGGRTINNGNYEFICGQTGKFNFSGNIRMTDNDGNTKLYPFNSEYTVGEPSVTISNVDLNVMYRGIDNKFSISAPGVPSSDISIRVDGGESKNQGGGRFLIKPTQDKDVKITVIGKLNGKEMVMGSSSYRVKYLPDPRSFLEYSDAAGIRKTIFDGELSKRLLRSNVEIIASYGDDELVKANFTVKSFSLKTVFGTVPATGSKFNARQMGDIEKLESGDLVTIRNIKAVGPDGKLRSLSSIQVSL